MAEQIVGGVTLRRAGSAIETVNPQKEMSLNLLASWDGTEVIRQQVAKGHIFGLRPEEGWNALECVYIVEGEAVCEDGGQTIHLGPGDCLAGAPVQEPLTLRAVTDLTILYVCSQPSFHMVSGQVAYLQQLADSVEAKDGYTADHCERIQDLALEVGKRLKLSPERQYTLYHGAYLHDLGKVGIPDEILHKPGKLTAEEWVIMKQHPTIGSKMLTNTVIAQAAKVLEQHHERVDGSGYPLGLRGNEICLEAKIIAVVDSFDAMTSDRVYRRGMPKAVAVKELLETAGTLYDQEVVQTFVEIIDG